MRAIVVDDEPLMLRRFMRLSAEIPDLTVVGQFESAKKALSYAEENPVEVAFLDVAMPVVNGIELAKELRRIRPDILIVFVSAYEEYIWDCNQIGGDYYVIKPYSRETLEMVMERIRLLAQRQQKEIYVQTFGRFLVLRNGKPLPISGKAKEILALVVTRRGKEISNEEIYRTIWENRPYGNVEMTVYYNALRKLKAILKEAELSDLLISTQRGQLVNTALFDCDYYAWQDKNMSARDRFEGEFMSEYSWGEYILADIFSEE
ncbi:MAG: response regulator [Oscillospiraceae bacterium]|nr:response regulator [Oscillospiraceae bacterium]